MRWAVLVLGLLGALGAAGVGVLFLMKTQEMQTTPQFKSMLVVLRSQDTPPAVRDAVRSYLALPFALPYFLFAALPLGIVGAMQAVKYHRWSALTLFLLSIVGPAVLAVGWVMAVAERGIRNESETVTSALTILLAPPLGLLALAAALCLGVRSPAPKPARDDHRDDYDD